MRSEIRAELRVIVFLVCCAVAFVLAVTLVGAVAHLLTELVLLGWRMGL
jgi:nitrate reductase NapE component